MEKYKVKRHYDENGLLLSDIIIKFFESFLETDLFSNKENDKMSMDMALYL